MADGRMQTIEESAHLQSLLCSLTSRLSYSTFSTFTEFVEPFDRSGIPAV